MALNAGVIHFTLEFGQKLKDQDWLGRQDPYAVVSCGTQTYRSKTHTDGGRNPVWNQTFQFNVINENAISVSVYDEDTMSRDDLIGSCTISLARAREQGQERVTAPLVSRTGRQHGHITASVRFEPNHALRPAAAPMAAYAPAAYAPAPYANYSPAYAAAQYMAPPAAAPYAYGAPQAYAPAPAAYSAPPPAPYGYAGAPPAQPYGAPAPQPYAQPPPQQQYTQPLPMQYSQQPGPQQYGAYPPAAPAPAPAPAPTAPSAPGYYPGVPSTYPPPIAFGQMPVYPAR